MPAAASISRRELLKGKVQPSTGGSPLPGLRPPGTTNQAIRNCTNCGLCVDACPRNILTLSGDGVVILPDRGECSFCGACADICPEPVFDGSRIIQHRFEISGDCLAHAGITCMACRDACPEAAISMLPRIGAPFLPRLNADACTGCGACVSPCPADAIIALLKENEDA